jgi:hypothetical protein
LLELFLRFLPVSSPPLNVPISATNPIYHREPNKDFTISHGRFFDIVTKKRSNNYGFINRRDYFPKAASPLLAIIGDSQVEAAFVDDDLTLDSRLQQQVGKNGRVYSFAFGGLKLPMYLAYAHYIRQNFHPDGMVFVIVGNDYDESISKFNNKPNYYLFYPTENEKLIWKLNPYQLQIDDRILRYSSLYRYIKNNLNGVAQIEFIRGKINNLFTSDKTTYNPLNVNAGDISIDTNPERVPLSKKGVDEYLRLLPEMTGLPADKILLVVEGRRYPEELDKPNAFPDIMREYLIQKAQEGGFEIIDLQAVLIEHYKQNHQRFEFPTDAHWNDLGHWIVAEQIKNSHLFKALFSKS